MFIQNLNRQKDKQIVYTTQSQKILQLVLIFCNAQLA